MAKILMASQGQGQAHKSIAFVEAGSNGCDWISISTALYMIDRLVKSDGMRTNVDYFIVPCSNPDSYKASFTPGNALDNLSFNYPIILGTSDMSKIRNKNFNKTIMAWKESYQHRRPESAALIQTIDRFHGRVKLFVSLQEGAAKPKILYPYGGCSDMLPDADMVTHIAKAASRLTQKLPFCVGSIYNACGLTFGSIVDYLASTRGLNFSYVMHVNNRLKKPDADKIERVGRDVLATVMSMAKNVKAFCDSQVF
nr:unnamed protein product [Callosobruchus chinensis]